MDGDEIAIVQLFEKAYGKYGGYSIKTPECWRWCSIMRPDVERNGIIVALDNGSKEIVGYVVAGKSGYVWELSYNPQSDGEEVVSLLLEEATKYIQEVGASSVNFNAPQKDAIIRHACQKHGFVASEPPRMFLSVLDLQGLVALLADDKANILSKKYNETLLIKIEDAPFWIDAALIVRINREGVKVGNDAHEPTIQLRTDLTTLSSVLFGNKAPISAFVHARLKIKPLSKTFTLLKLLSTLRVNTAWFYPLSDYG